VVSCTNFNKTKDVAVDCRFFHDFNGIVAGGGPQDALCNTGFLTLGPGDSGQCATNVDDTRQRGASELSNEIFTTAGGSAECPAFEGKGSCVQLVMMIIWRKLSARPISPALVVRYWRTSMSFPFPHDDDDY
jgi:hypothetical protein